MQRRFQVIIKGFLPIYSLLRATDVRRENWFTYSNSREGGGGWAGTVLLPRGAGCGEEGQVHGSRTRGGRRAWFLPGIKLVTRQAEWRDILEDVIIPTATCFLNERQPPVKGSVGLL